MELVVEVVVVVVEEVMEVVEDVVVVVEVEDVVVEVEVVVVEVDDEVLLDEVVEVEEDDVEEVVDVLVEDPMNSKSLLLAASDSQRLPEGSNPTARGTKRPPCVVAAELAANPGWPITSVLCSPEVKGCAKATTRLLRESLTHRLPVESNPRP